MMIKAIYISLFILFFCEFSWCAQIQINSQSAQKNDIVTFTVFIHDAPDPVNAFGFDISYDPTCMTYKSVQRGSLISEGFRFFQASNVGFGRIRIGGIETGDNIIHQQDVGSLALIQFNVIGEKNSSVILENLKDDFKTWSTQNGQLVLQDQETDDETETEDTVSNDIMDTNENDIPKSTSDDETLTNQDVQTDQDTISPPDFPSFMTNDHTQTKKTNTINILSQNRQASDHGESSQTPVQSKVGNNQKFSQTNQENLTDKSYYEQKSTDESNDPQAAQEHHESHQMIPTETLTKKEWRHVKSVGLSAGSGHNSTRSHNQILLFPSFLSFTILISIIVQLGVLIMLILIYRQLSTSERR